MAMPIDGRLARWRRCWRRRHLRTALIALTSQLLQLLEAHMPLPEALRLLHHTMAQPLARDLAGALWQGIARGQSLHQVMATQPHLFQPLWVHIMAVSSQTGQLVLGLKGWHADLVQQQAMQQQWRQALAYPTVLFSVFVGVLVCLWVWVLPHFALLFAQMHAAVPPLMQRMLHVATAWQCAPMLWVVSVCGMGVVVCVVWRGICRALGINLWRHVPVVGRVLQHMRLCQQLHVLYLLAKANMPWPQGVALMAMEAHAAQKHWQRCYRAILSGQPLHQALQCHPDFDKVLCACLATAEHSGQLTATLAHVSAQHAMALTQRVSRMQRCLMPWMTLVMGAAVALLMVVMYMPLLQLGDALWSTPMVA